ncbi:MAG: MMPL family transporter [Bacteroidales bacterium]|nr:MMPL family transporter [Bacteroidales bacterium]
MLYQIFNSITQAILKFRILIYAIILFLIVVAVLMLPNLKIDNSISSWYAEDDPTLLEYNHFLNTFGNDEVIVSCISDSLPYYNSKRIQSTINLVKDIEKVEGIAFVTSYVNIPYKYIGDRYETLSEFNNDFTSVPNEASIQKWMEANTLKNQLIGESSEYIIIYVWPDTLEIIEQSRDKIISNIDSICTAPFNGNKAHIAMGGTGVIYNGINKVILTEGSYFMIFSYLILILTMIVVSRSYFITLLTFIIITVATTLLFGFMAISGKSINTVTLALPPLIMVIGVSNIVHFTLHSRQKLGSGTNSSSIILPVLATIAIPVIFNMITTAGGFFSLTTASVGITRDYGLLAAVSIILVSVLSFIAIIIFHKRIFKINLSFEITPSINKLVKYLMIWSYDHYKKVIVVALMVMLLSVWGIVKINVDTEPLSFIPKKHIVRQDHELITQQIGNYIPLEFVVQFKKGNWRAKQNLSLLNDIQNIIAADNDVNSTLSIVDFVVDAYQNTPGKKLTNNQDLSDLSQQKILLIGSKLLKEPFIKRLSTRKGDEVRITATIPMTTAKTFKSIHNRIKNKVQSQYEDQISITPSGYLPLYSAIVDTVLTDQIKSILIAIFVILIIIFIILQSKRLTLIAFPSNIIPVLLILGTMGFFHINLDIATVTLAATVLGIIVDDSLHILFTYKKLLSEGHSLVDSTKMVASLTGSAVVSTSVILMLGYSVIAFSSVPILSVTGIMMIIAIGSALLADLFLLPALIRLFIKTSKS